MTMLFLLTSLFAAVVDSRNTWFLGRPSKVERSALIEANCFHGAFGARDLSVFSCTLPETNFDSFTTEDRDDLLCFVELAHPLEAQRLVESSVDSRILWNSTEEMIVGGIHPSSAYPSMCLSRSDYNGFALNVITIPNHSFKPSTYDVLAGVKPVPQDLITEIISQVTSSALHAWDERIAYGATLEKKWKTRQSYSEGAKLAVHFVAEEFLSRGFVVETWQFLPEYCANVIAEIKGTTHPEEIVVLGSHLDSRSTLAQDPDLVAPGADDNGTGVSINLELARLIRDNKLKFGRTLRLITFCGEEQGLVGSREQARRSKQANENIVVMYNVDMVGYTQPGTKPTIAFMTGSTTLNATNSCKALTETYIDTPIGNTAACCSDQQSYFSQGYPAVSFFETPTPSVVYPDYHKMTDTPDKVNFEQVKAFAQAAYACALTAAQVHQ